MSRNDMSILIFYIFLNFLGVSNSTDIRLDICKDRYRECSNIDRLESLRDENNVEYMIFLDKKNYISDYDSLKINISLINKSAEPIIIPANLSYFTNVDVEIYAISEEGEVKSISLGCIYNCPRGLPDIYNIKTIIYPSHYYGTVVDISYGVYDIGIMKKSGKYKIFSIMKICADTAKNKDKKSSLKGKYLTGLFISNIIEIEVIKVNE